MLFITIALFSLSPPFRYQVIVNCKERSDYCIQFQTVLLSSVQNDVTFSHDCFP